MNQMKDLENPRVILAAYLRQIRYGIPGRSLVSFCLEFCYRLSLFSIHSMINSALTYRVANRDYLGVKEHIEGDNNEAEDPPNDIVGVNNILDEAEPIVTVKEAILDVENSNNNNIINNNSAGVTQLNRGKKNTRDKK